MGAAKSIIMASSATAVEMGQMKNPMASSSAIPAGPAQPDAIPHGDSDTPSTLSVLTNIPGTRSTNLRSVKQFVFSWSPY